MNTTNHVQEVTDATFQSEVLSSQQPVMVDFWAPWCGPCRSVAPVVEQLAAEMQGRVKIVKVNVDSNPTVAQTYRIQSIPNLVFFHGGKRVGDLLGAQPRAAILQKLQQIEKQANAQGSAATETRILACPSCGQKNRVPVSRTGEAVCGKCGSALSG